MRKALTAILLIIFIIVAFDLISLAQETPKKNIIYYDGQIYTTAISAPQDWEINIDDARIDNRTAAIYPFKQRYYKSDMIIYIWIYGKDTLSFSSFITADSLRYLRKNKEIKFIKNDTATICGDRKIVLIENDDPGAVSNIATVAYADAGTEIIVFELDVSYRSYFAEGQSTLWWVLKNLSITPKEE
jgi:hypothetical protein